MIKIKEIFELIGKSEIKYFKISDLFEIKQGRVISKTYIAENPGKFPVYSSATQNNGEIGKISTFDFDGEFLTITTHGKYAGTVFYRNEKFSITSNCLVLKNKTENNTRFLFYIFRNSATNYVNFSQSIQTISKSVIKNIKIPVPPIEIQEKILNIFEKIENFDALIDILDSEKELRLKQLNFYKNKILSFLDLKPTTHTHTERERERESKKVCKYFTKIFSEQLLTYISTNLETKKISDLFEIKRGNPKFTKEFINKNPGNFPVYSGSILNQGEIGKISTYDFEGEFLTWTIAGYAGHIFYRNGKFNTTNLCGVLKQKPEHKNNLKFFSYILPKYTLNNVIVRKKGYTILQSSELLNIEIPVPPIEIQEKVVEILDKINSFKKEITKGLEIENQLIKKQHQYYKSVLLKLLKISDSSLSLSLSEQIVNLFDLIWQKAFEFIGNFQFFDFLKYKKSIGEITKLTRGNGKLTKKFIEKNPGIFPVYSGSTINNGEIGKISTFDFEGEFLTWTIDGYAGTVFYRNEKFSANSHCGIIEIKDQKIVNPKFLQYILQTLTPKFVNFDATIPSLSMEKMKKIEVLIPAKIIQDQIANDIEMIQIIFNKINYNIEKEIKFLKKQQNFYRNLIFDKFKIL
ncbi:restriction endonuclease subunit S [Mesomycoplasma dispar]|uniref:Type I restriction modification DNA specificity domain-containing protein n=1 Tax=Mesomycoplasma dispar TaxID=86660 RepID=A0ABM6PRK7_9BACT|nr:restriction endonuclease subunit S [Mesomycoplasma dispar]ATP59834.1 hypothetical protein CSW10_02765 [Mesomycoplasma dispar]